MQQPHNGSSPPVPSQLIDRFGRRITYIRLSITDRCNLRCQYCMPEEGITYVDRKDLLTFEEIERVIAVGAQLGVSKLRITGGEPFLRKGLIESISRMNQIEGISSIHITTNGTLIDQHIPHFKELGIKSVNLSLDSLDEDRFFEITRRNDLHKVMDALTLLIDHEISTKINMVVMNQRNISDILPMIELTKHLPISVRYLEEMPFNGVGAYDDMALWDHKKILDFIRDAHPNLYPVENGPNSTSVNYKIPGYAGSFGIIASYSRLFCGTCNRIRLTPIGLLKTCLYDNGIFNIRDLIRNGATDQDLATALKSALANRAKDGKEAEARRSDSLVQESMATIGG